MVLKEASCVCSGLRTPLTTHSFRRELIPDWLAVSPRAWKLHLNIPPPPNDREQPLGKGRRFSLSSQTISASRGHSASHSQWWSGLELPPALPVPPRAVLDVHARGGTQRSRRGGGGGGCGARRGNGCRKQAGRTEENS
ncbi:hypothetical protein PGIGA_G00072530 [Pangasianodon gigas]|uniref:Uncharacterized protein n=1 Tax=Pangasianodon gigas TaxID=30993 RepID=A0ACC5X7S8_PANGG|nr:hypothetical protein [Pangasianodon gigas]